MPFGVLPTADYAATSAATYAATSPMPFGVFPTADSLTMGKQDRARQCHQCLSAFSPLLTRLFELGIKPHTYMSPMPFGVFPTADWVGMFPRAPEKTVTNAFRRFPHC